MTDIDHETALFVGGLADRQVMTVRKGTDTIVYQAKEMLTAVSAVPNDEQTAPMPASERYLRVIINPLPDAPVLFVPSHVQHDEMFSYALRKLATSYYRAPPPAR